MLDRIIEDCVHKDRDQFINSIQETDICRLASSYHNNEPCAFFKPPAQGSYNICFFVRFCSCSTNNTSDSDGKNVKEGDSWVVRVPLSPCLAFGAHEKLESEVATMQFIAEHTTIPIPRIHAYSFLREKGPHNIASFVILEYVEGRSLFDVKLKTLSENQRRHLYNQLADIYIQLRRLEFTSIGVLSRGSEGVEVRKKPVSIGINEQELEGLKPSLIQVEHGCRGVLTSASDYVTVLRRIAWNVFEKGRKSVYSEEDGNETLYNLHQFFRFVEDKWLKPTLDSGPFVLLHGDLNPYNLIVNENIDIMALLDWEWSRVAPLQFFMPPTWLTNRDTDTLAWPSLYSQYVDELGKFRVVVRDRELELYVDELLSNDWARVHEDGGILIHTVLDNWTDIDYFVGRYLDKLLYQRKDLKVRIKAFIEEDPARKKLVARKIRDWMDYRAERKRLGINDPADDKIEDEETPLGAECTEGSVTSATHIFSWLLSEVAGMSSKTD